MRAYTSPSILRLAMAITSLLLSNAAAAQATSETSSEQGDVTELAKKLENPISDLISVPFQNNTNFDYGSHNDTQNVLNIQPVIPFQVTDDWNLITRMVLPLISQPALQRGSGSIFGSGPTTFSAFLSPNKAFDGWFWGGGPIVQLPTPSSDRLGSNVWGGGPTAVVIRTDGPFVYGGLMDNVWSFGGNSVREGTRYNTFLAQPIFAYNFGRGWSIASVPIITANWRQPGEKWTLPLGGQVGRVVKLFDKLPVNFTLGAYYNALRPDPGAKVELRSQITLIFPTGG